MPDVVADGHRLPAHPGRSLLDAVEELGVAVPASCRSSGRCHECVVEVSGGAEQLTPPTDAESFLAHGFRLACQARVARTDRDVVLAVLRRPLRILLESADAAAAPVALDPAITVERGTVMRGAHPIGPRRGPLLGLALDVGTTSVVFELVDLESGVVVHVGGFENPQRFGGSDVMTRIAYERDRPGELRRALRRGLNHALAASYRALGVDRHDVYDAVVVGNTTMRDLFFGLDVAPIGAVPFRSVTEAAMRTGGASTTALTRAAHELGMFVHPNAEVLGGPIVGSHVGADAAADLLATGFARRPGVSLLVDIGTNTELVISNGSRMLAASSPAGPAFEGGGVASGMPAVDGAIESIRWVRGEPAWVTIGGADPVGLCGSGLVDALAGALARGLLLPEGRLAPGTERIDVVHGARVGLSRRDVSNLAQAKAATASAARVLMRSVGVVPSDLDRVILAGGFANALDVGNAIAIGLLPPVPPNRVVRAGNASVAGARAMLVSRAARHDLDRLARGIGHVELEAEPDYFELFTDGCRFEPIGPAPRGLCGG